MEEVYHDTTLWKNVSERLSGKFSYIIQRPEMRLFLKVRMSHSVAL